MDLAEVGNLSVLLNDKQLTNDSMTRAFIALNKIHKILLRSMENYLVSRWSVIGGNRAQIFRSLGISIHFCE